MCYFFLDAGGGWKKRCFVLLFLPTLPPLFFSACFAFFGVRFLHTGWLQWQEDQSGGSSG